MKLTTIHEVGRANDLIILVFVVLTASVGRHYSKYSLVRRPHHVYFCASSRAQTVVSNEWQAFTGLWNFLKESLRIQAKISEVENILAPDE